VSAGGRSRGSSVHARRPVPRDGWDPSMRFSRRRTQTCRRVPQDAFDGSTRLRFEGARDKGSLMRPNHDLRRMRRDYIDAHKAGYGMRSILINGPARWKRLRGRASAITGTGRRRRAGHELWSRSGRQGRDSQPAGGGSKRFSIATVRGYRKDDNPTRWRSHLTVLPPAARFAR
jgi:hypothetical protein